MRIEGIQLPDEKLYYEDHLVRVYNGHTPEILKTMPDEFVHTVVTSPPYWGLRDYGLEPQIWDGDDACEHEWIASPPRRERHPEDVKNPASKQATNKGANCELSPQRFCQLCGAWKGSLGLESTPELYVQHLVGIFREIKRVLRVDGTVFLNLGDSYMGSGGAHKEHHSNPGLSKSFERGGVSREAPCDISDKELVNYQDRGCLCGSLCGVCREVYRNHRFRNDDLLGSMLIASLSLPNQVNMESQNDHSPTLDWTFLENHILTAIQNQENFSAHESGQPLSFQESMPDLFSQQLLDLCLQRGSSSSCLLCGRSLKDNVREFSHKSVGHSKKSYCIQGSASGVAVLEHCNQNINKVCGYCIASYNDYTNIKPESSLKPKDLCGIPWRAAFALQADGWWLRQDIIWNKENCMPESVKDRCTKSHEYIFLLTKSAKYYYDGESIGRNIKISTIERYKRGWGGNGERGYPDGPQNHLQNFMDPQNEKRVWGNKLSVWTVNTRPYPQAHFAVFPPELIVPCIKAGSPKGGVILDPFGGSGTTADVSKKLERRCISIELNPKYCELHKQRWPNMELNLEDN